MASVSTLINRMRYWCAVANLGYSQADRWNFNPSGGNCDCSSLVIHCLKEAGFDTGSATYTGNLSDNLTKRGWTRLPADGNPQAGDILLNDVHHVAVYLGGGRLAQASISERGTAYGRAGDQTGRETNIRAYYNYPWNAYLRYMGAQSSAQAAVSGAIAVDGNVGPATVRRWQQVMGTAVDGIIKHPEDNPSIGLLLCKSKNDLVAEYALKDMSKPIGVSEYKITSSLPEALSKQLPSVEDIQKRWCPST